MAWLRWHGEGNRWYVADYGGELAVSFASRIAEAVQIEKPYSFYYEIVRNWKIRKFIKHFAKLFPLARPDHLRELYYIIHWVVCDVHYEAARTNLTVSEEKCNRLTDEVRKLKKLVKDLRGGKDG